MEAQVRSGSRWAGIAGLLVMVVAGCSNEAGATPQPAGSSAAGQAPARTWQEYSAGCRELTAPPYGVAPTGKRVPSWVATGEQEILDRVIPGASFEQATCEYTVADQPIPSVSADIKIFGGEAGTAEATAWFESEKAASSQLGGGVDNAEVPDLADGAFALYFEPTLHLKTRSGNAYISVSFKPGTEAVQTFDKLQPLQQQIPALVVVMKDVLTGLK
jgi:hypothetical protein